MTNINLTMNKWHLQDKMPYIYLGESGENNVVILNVEVDDLITSTNNTKVTYFVDIYNQDNLQVANTQPFDIIDNKLVAKLTKGFLTVNGIKKLQIRCVVTDNDYNELQTYLSNQIHASVGQGNFGTTYNTDLVDVDTSCKLIIEIFEKFQELFDITNDLKDDIAQQESDLNNLDGIAQKFENIDDGDVDTLLDVRYIYFVTNSLHLPTNGKYLVMPLGNTSVCYGQCAINCETQAIYFRNNEIENDVITWHEWVSSNDAQEQEIQQIKDDVQTLSDNVDDLHTNIKDLDNSVDDLQDNFSQLQSNVSGLNSNVQTLNNSVDSLNGDVQTLQNDVSGLNDDIQTLDGNISDIQDDINNIWKTAKTVYYVSTSGNDNNNGTQSSPLATVNKALELGADVIYLEGGRYFQQIDLSKTNKSKVKISNISANTRVIFTDADRKLATSATQTSGYTRIYQFPCNITFDDNNKWIFQENVADISTLIDDNDRLPSQRGYKYRCYHTKIVKCQSTTLSDALNEIENAEENEYKWYLDNGILYCSCRNEIGSDTPISYSLGKTLFLHPNKKTSVELVGISCQFIGINITDMISPQVIDCQVFNYYGAGGIEYTRSMDVNIVRCETAHIFSGSVGDGINAHGQIGGTPVDHNVTATITDCWSHDNNDDGFSDHECCESVIIGGLYEHNGKAGITPSYGSHCTCRNVISRNNYNGFYYVGEASQAEQGQYGQLLCIDCVSESNIYGDGQAHAGYLSAGNGNRVTLVNCKSLNNRYGYYAASGTSMRMIDCTSYDTQFKVGSGTFSITSVIDDINTTLNTKLDKTSSLPTPSATYLDKVYLLTSTQTGYQKGEIYQCISDGASTPTYSWQLISSGDMIEFTTQELQAMW